MSTPTAALAQPLKQELGEVNFYINEDCNLYPAFRTSLKDKLAINESTIGDKYTQVLYSFNRLKNNINARMQFWIAIHENDVTRFTVKVLLEELDQAFLDSEVVKKAR